MGYISKLSFILLLPVIMFLSACSLTSGGSDGGVFRSDDGGKTFSQKVKTENNKTIGDVDVLSLSLNPQNGSQVYVGSRSAGIFRTDDAGETWKQLQVSRLTPTKVYSLAVDPQNPADVFAAAVVGKRGKIVKSADAGETWKDIYTEPADGTLVLSLAVDSKNPQNVFAGTDKGQIIFSEDAGETWRNLYWTEGNKAVYKIAIDSVDSSVVYFVIFQGEVLRTLDGGKNFEKLLRERGEDTFSSQNEIKDAVSIKADPFQEGWVYVGTSEGLLRSKDKGENWEVVKTLSEPDELNIRSIAVNPQNSDEIVAVVAQAFYKSVDGGTNWLPVQFSSTKTLEAVEYNPQNPQQIFVGVNKR